MKKGWTKVGDKFGHHLRLLWAKILVFQVTPSHSKRLDDNDDDDDGNDSEDGFDDHGDDADDPHDHGDDDDDDDDESHLWSEVAWLLHSRSNICWTKFLINQSFKI